MSMCLSCHCSSCNVVELNDHHHLLAVGTVDVSHIALVYLCVNHLDVCVEHLDACVNHLDICVDHLDDFCVDHLDVF